MFYAITINGGLITAVHESLKEITENTFKNTIFEGQTVIPIPEGSEVKSNTHLGEYDEHWHLKPLAQRAAEGFVVIPADYIVDGEEIRPMTPEERIAAGLDEPPEEPSPEEIAEQARQARIYELKSLLAVDDYKIIKCYEYSLAGRPLPYDIEELHNIRQAMRDEINELEAAM